MRQILAAVLLSVAAFAQTTINAARIEKVRYADQFTYGSSTGGIQEAINDTPDGGEVIIPVGTYSLCANLPITITKRIYLHGQGWGTNLQLCSSANGTTDVITLAPQGSTTIMGWKFADFQISVQSGTPGRYGIYLNGAGGQILNGRVENVRIAKLGSKGIYADGSGLAQGTPVLTTFDRNVVYGGFGFANAGDTVQISNGQIPGFPGDTSTALDISFQPGSSTFVLEKNNITAGGGIHIGTGATSVRIENNEIETAFSGYVGSHGALIDIDGTGPSPALDTIIKGNTCQIGILINCVRANNAARTSIEGNRFGRGTAGSKDITLTANSSDTRIGYNVFVNGLPLSDMVENNSTSASYLSPITGRIIMSPYTFLGGIDETGASRLLLGMDGTGTTTMWGYHDAPAVQGTNGRMYIYSSNTADPNTVIAFADIVGFKIANAKTLTGYSDLGTTPTWNITGTGASTWPGLGTFNAGVTVNNVALSTTNGFTASGTTTLNSGVTVNSTASLNNNLTVGGTTTIGFGNNGVGDTFHAHNTAVLDFGNLAAIGCEDLTIAVTGAASGDSVHLGIPNGSVPTTTAQFTGWVSAPGTVTVRYCDLVGGNPASGTFRADVWR